MTLYRVVQSHRKHPSPGNTDVIRVDFNEDLNIWDRWVELCPQFVLSFEGSTPNLSHRKSVRVQTKLISAVVCVCVFLRGEPSIGSDHTEPGGTSFTLLEVISSGRNKGSRQFPSRHGFCRWVYGSINTKLQSS